MPSLFSLDRTWRFPCSPGELWAALERVDEYASWWPWLRAFDARPPGLVPGAVVRCVGRHPVVPVALRFRIEIVEARPGRRVALEVRGDLMGSASVELVPVDGDPGAVDVRAAWDVDLHHRSLGPLARLTRALAPRGQEWVVGTSLRHFRRAVLGLD